MKKNPVSYNQETGEPITRSRTISKTSTLGVLKNFKEKPITKKGRFQFSIKNGSNCCKDEKGVFQEGNLKTFKQTASKVSKRTIRPKSNLPTRHKIPRLTKIKEYDLSAHVNRYDLNYNPNERSHSCRHTFSAFHKPVEQHSGHSISVLTESNPSITNMSLKKAKETSMPRFNYQTALKRLAFIAACEHEMINDEGEDAEWEDDEDDEEEYKQQDSVQIALPPVQFYSEIRSDTTRVFDYHNEVDKEAFKKGYKFIRKSALDTSVVTAIADFSNFNISSTFFPRSNIRNSKM